MQARQLPAHRQHRPEEAALIVGVGRPPCNALYESLRAWGLGLRLWEMATYSVYAAQTRPLHISRRSPKVAFAFRSPALRSFPRILTLPADRSVVTAGKFVPCLGFHLQPPRVVEGSRSGRDVVCFPTGEGEGRMVCGAPSRLQQAPAKC